MRRRLDHLEREVQVRQFRQGSSVVQIHERSGAVFLARVSVNRLREKKGRKRRRIEAERELNDSKLLRKKMLTG